MSLKWDDTIINKIEEADKAGLTECARQVQSQAKKLIKEKKAIDTGRLLNSIEYKVEKNEAVIGTDLFYSIFIEYGTRFMPPRSYLREGLDLVKKDLKNIYVYAYNQVMK